MTTSRVFCAILLALSQWVSVSIQLETCSGQPLLSKVKVVYEAEHPNVTAPPDYFYEQLLQAQHDFFFLRQSTAFHREPFCIDYHKSQNGIIMSLEKFPDTRTVNMANEAFRFINETASINRRIWVTGFRPKEHYRNATETGKWQEVLVGHLFANIYSWKNRALDDDLVPASGPPELTREHLLGVMERCDACIQDHPETFGQCGRCCRGGDYPGNLPWYCGLGTSDPWYY